MFVTNSNLEIVGENDALIWSEFWAVVDVVKFVADNGEKIMAGVGIAFDADKYFGIFEIGFDVGEVASIGGEDYACAPVGAAVGAGDEFVSFDDETGNDAIG
jgi:hypothetical protein